MKPGQDLFDVTCNVLQGLKPILQAEQPDLVLVHGDTTTTMAGPSLPTTADSGRSRRGWTADLGQIRPVPEEINRKIAGCVTDMHFAPTASRSDNLLREGVAGSAITSPETR